jgi:TonB family protein
MKPPAGYDQPRRRTASGKKPVRLDLRPTKRPPTPEEEIERSQHGQFWKWFLVVALFHVFVLVALTLYYRLHAPPPPPEPFISLMPEGDTVKGTAGAQAAPKLGASTAAPTLHHHHHTDVPKKVPPPAPTPPVTPPPAPTPTPEAIQPPAPAVIPEPAPTPQIETPNGTSDRTPPKPKLSETKPKPLKPAKAAKTAKTTPPKPKLKVDLHLVERDAASTDVTDAKPKPKHLAKKSPPKPLLGDDVDDQPDTSADTHGLSREQIAKKLGAKLDAEGVLHADKLGDSGAAHSTASPYADFYNSIREQITDKWQVPNQDAPDAVNPVVQIHVEKDGRVPPDRVTLLQSSGNSAIDDSALAAARSMGYTLEPLPDGCPPDIKINLQLNH